MSVVLISSRIQLSYMKLAREEANLESTTIRLPSSLKSIITEAAKEHGRNFSEEIRDALQAHYKTTAATATLNDINEAILEHVKSMHLSPQKHYHKIESEKEALETPAARTLAKKSRGRRERLSAEEALADTKLVLEKLLDHLRNGEEVTARQLERETGIPSRVVSQLLKDKDILAKNTRLQGVAGRYYLREMVTVVEMAYREMASEHT